VDLARDVYAAVDFALAVLASKAGERLALRSHKTAGALALNDLGGCRGNGSHRRPLP
jgi:hypothetical protein